jgi:serine protease Do
VIERVKPAVVSISTHVSRQLNTIWGQIFTDEAGPSGTGVVIYEDGFIITNYHVVSGATQIQVKFDPADDDRIYDAVVLSKIPEEDLALIKITGEEPFHTVTLCESDPILGEDVIAIGNAFGHSHTVSTGIVSGLHRDIGTREGLRFENLIQTDASINQGNSGGPLLNIDGELIGINSAMQNMAENIGFAIPVGRVRKVLSEQLLALSEARSWLGFDVDEDTLVVERVVPGGPADLAGIQLGDKLQSLAGHLLASLEGDVRDLYRRVRISIQPGEPVELTVLRGKGQKSFELRARNKVDGILFERLGLGVETVRMRGGDLYLRVTEVQDGGPAGVAGIQVDDVLTTVQREGRRAVWFQRPDDLANVVVRFPPGTVLKIELWRDLNANGIYFERDPLGDYSEGLRGPLTVR